MKKIYFLALIYSMIAGTSDAQKIAAGSNHSLFVCTTTTAKSCGDNSEGDIGDYRTSRPDFIHYKFIQGKIYFHINSLSVNRG
ncbi:MAG: hypothetical protein HYY40_07265 [Bacteroidetes bacterium]|nr:hypothetical protein [Bacteroidota bacterium]